MKWNSINFARVCCFGISYRNKISMKWNKLLTWEVVAHKLRPYSLDKREFGKVSTTLICWRNSCTVMHLEIKNNWLANWRNKKLITIINELIYEIKITYEPYSSVRPMSIKPTNRSHLRCIFHYLPTHQMLLPPSPIFAETFNTCPPTKSYHPNPLLATK